MLLMLRKQDLHVPFQHQFQGKNDELNMNSMASKDSEHVLYEPMFPGKNILLCSECPDVYTVRKMDPILRSIQRMLQTQLSMARKFTLQPYHR
jgi:hypothetical protein